MTRARDRSRPFDIVLFGATGFTGQLVAEYLVRHYSGSDLRLALAGRSETKLERVRDRLTEIDASAGALPIRIADSHDEAALSKLAAEASVVCTTVGPYAKYGAALVAACVRHGTDYCDLTGETQFIRRMIDQHHQEARRTGARIVHCCGYDSIPSDLGTLTLQEAFKARHGRYASVVRHFAGESSGGISGGTIASMLNLFDEMDRDPSVRKILGHPYALNPEGERRGPDGSDQATVRFDRELGMWTGPFVMAAINSRIVRRSHALLGYPWGRDFRYEEAMSFGKGPKAMLMATAVTGGLAGFIGLVAVPPLRRLIAKKLPAPGEGPSEEKRTSGYFRSRLLARGEDESGADASLRALVEGQQDPGYGETAKMLSESALCLALEGEKLDVEGGVRTPASTMGMHLVERLRARGMTFDV